MTDHVRILLIDDDQEDFLIVSDMLAEAENTRFRLDWVQTYEAGLEAISRQEHDVYLLDYFMGSHNGLDLLKKAVEGGCKAPIIFLTAHGNYAVDLKAMEAGASDYLVKGEFTAPDSGTFDPLLHNEQAYRGRAEAAQEQSRGTCQEKNHSARRSAGRRREAGKRGRRRQAILEALLEHIPVGDCRCRFPGAPGAGAQQVRSRHGWPLRRKTTRQAAAYRSGFAPRGPVA